MSKATALLAACAVAVTVPVSMRAEPAVVSLARAYLGPESTILGINDIHYTGTLTRTDSAHPGGPPEVDALDMVFVKPMRQRMVIHGAKVSMTSVLDGYDAWDRLVDNADPTKFRLTWLKADDIRMLQANTVENLYYYRMPDVAMEDKGPATADNIACERIDITHEGGIVFERFFDRDTGRLVLTVRGDEEIRETGEMMVDGLRFPTQVESRTKLANGVAMVSTATFTKITINEPVSSDLFAVPSIAPPETPPAAAQPAAAAPAAATGK